MKKIVSAGLLFIIITILAACSGSTEVSKQLVKEGIAPYELSDSETYLLQSFGMEGNSQMISFHAPKETGSLSVNVYRLEDDGIWSSIGGGAISLDADGQSTDQLTGTFAMQIKENYTVEFHINAGGRASYRTEEILLENEAVISTKGFLQEFQTIVKDREIPVALMVYDSGNSMKSYSLQDYFEPSKFEGMDLVQVVTLKFSDK